MPATAGETDVQLDDQAFDVDHHCSEAVARNGSSSDPTTRTPRVSPIRPVVKDLDAFSDREIRLIARENALARSRA